MSAEMFHFDAERPSFEDLGIPNGSRTWRAADLMTALGYSNAKTFHNAIVRAQQACLSVNLRCEENFIPFEGSYKLTRFACYLVAMNGDPKKPEVAAAQAYFAALANTFQSHLEHADGIDRVVVREDLTVGMKSLGSTAKTHGVTNYAFFHNAGYRGMYNMDLAALLKHKGLNKGDSLADRMGRSELAANLFRVTQTDEKIRKDGAHGQRQLESVASNVGRTVRETMIKLGNSPPEHLPIAAPIEDVKKALKSSSKNLRAIDAPKPRPKRLPAKSGEPGDE